MEQHLFKKLPRSIKSILDATLHRVVGAGLPSNLSVQDATTLLSVRDSVAVQAVASAADACRQVAPCNDNVTYVLNRNINFTNACVKACGFCAFSRTGVDEEAYFLPLPEIVARAKEAAALGASEVCVQAGLPPNMHRDLYLNVAKAIRGELPTIHLHAFSPEEVVYGAKRRKVSIVDMIKELKSAGVNTLPGTSAEILDDSVRQRIAKGRLSTAEWCEVITSAHSVGVPTTATVMYGHVETPHHVAAHIGLIRTMQSHSQQHYDVGFTEFVPLSFVAKEAPMWRNRADPDMRNGPTGNEVVLTHAVSRLMLAGHIHNIQVSWVKEGFRMAQVLLNAGVNDLGGTLMNESISTAAGAGHGQLATPLELRELIRGAGRVPVERHTNYTVRRTFEDEDQGRDHGRNGDGSGLNAVVDAEATFGSFDQLRRGQTNRFKDHHSRRQYSTLAHRVCVMTPSISTSSSSRQHSSSAAAAQCLSDTAQSAAALVKQITYSSSYTIVPTYECFNACSYCNFRTNVRADESAMLTVDGARDVLRWLRERSDRDPTSAVDEILILSGEIHPKHHR